MRDTKEIIYKHYDALPILIEFIKKCKNSDDRKTMVGAIETLHKWDRARSK